MPKKPKKTKEERLVEGFFPIKEDSLKYAVEKKYTQPDLRSLETVEKVSKKPIKKKTYSRKPSAKRARTKTTSKKNSYRNAINYQTPKIALKKGGYELIITEKPQAALKIASALGKSTKNNLKGIPYYELTRQGKKIFVACAVGHLFTLKQNNSGQNGVTFDISWVPNFLARKGDFTKKYYDTILHLAKQAGSVTVATDYDVEGEVIGLNVVRYICNQQDASRMKFSTLTEKELNEAYEKKSPTLNWGQAIAGETRHYLDWFYGINLSRALMNAIKTTGRFKIMSIGRVQGPTLDLIVHKEKEIQAFKSQPYWQVFINVHDGKNSIELKHNKDIFKKNELDRFKDLKGQKVKLQTIKTTQKLPPNPPFNLTALQTEAYRIHGIAPAETLKLAQSLYLSGLISYPRTSSQKLPDSIDYKSILKKLAREFQVEELIKRTKPIEGKKSDPAHPSIYPTGAKNSPILSGNEEKIYNLIVKRFLSLFCEDAEIDKKKIETEVQGLKFSTKGDSVKKPAWLKIYPYKIAEKELPDMAEDAEITKVRTEEKETQPPKRYTQASIISELEKRNLGTKATRSSILETLYDREYVKEKSIEATPLGISLIDTLEKYSPIIIDEKLTRDFEKQMTSIESSKKGFTEKQKIIVDKAKEMIIDIIKDFEKNENKIGQELLQANIEQVEQKKIANKLMQCPKCKKGNLTIMYSKKNKRYFVACDAYPECSNTYTLPPNGLIKKTEQVCEACGYPKLMSLKKGARPWFFCFNPECPTNKQRIEEYRKKQLEGK